MFCKYTVIRSSRTSLALVIRPDGEVVVRAPYRTSEESVRRFVESKKNWIVTHLAKIQEARQEMTSLDPLGPRDIRRLADAARKVIPGRVAHYAPLVGVTYGRITIRNQKTRWGSCSASGNLNFNCLLMLAPPEVLDSVVVHELCHRKYMDHSDRFYAEVYRVFPEYDRWHGWLKQHGPQLILRMTGPDSE